MTYAPIADPRVTAVIPVYNEEACLEACIDSLRRQDLKPMEIIVVDDGSTDSSPEICRRLGIKTLFQRHRGPGAARNLGAKEAAGNIILLVDADMTFAPGYVAALAAPIISGEIAGTSHMEELVSNWDSAWARVQTWFLGCPDGTRGNLAAGGATTVYRAVRKDFFISAGGFAENESRGDDSSLAARTGLLPAMVSGAVCYHRNIDGPAEGFFDARWRGRDAGSNLSSPAAFIKNSLWDRNPLRDVAAGVRITVKKGEPLALVYAAVFSLGYQCGLYSAYLRGKYLK